MSEGNKYQSRYWKELDETKVQTIYFFLYLQKTIKMG